MEQLMILTIDTLAPSHLPARLEAVHQAYTMKYLIADWWNRPGAFAKFGAGLSELKANPDECTGGRAFGDAADVSWRQVGDEFRVLLVTDGSATEFLKAEKESRIDWNVQVDEVVRVIDSEPIEVILWGTKHVGDDDNPTEPSKWVEGRIPRELLYPITPVRMNGKDKKRDFEAVILHAIAYYDARGRPVVYRRYRLRAQLESEERARKRKERRDLTYEDDDAEIPGANEAAMLDNEPTDSDANAESATADEGKRENRCQNLEKGS